MKRFAFRLAATLGIVAYLRGNAQAQNSSPWPVTRLDSVATVGMPYGGTIDESGLEAGVLMYTTSTSTNVYEAVMFTPKTTKPLKPGMYLVPDAPKFLSALMKVPTRTFSRPKLKASYLITLPSAPGGQAMHQVYGGFDGFNQEPAALELTWAIIGSSIYVFRCTYRLAQQAEAAEDLQHFFSSINFRPVHP